MKNYDNFVNGKFVPSQGSHRIVVRNPATGADICTVPDSGLDDVSAAVEAAEAAQRLWEKEPAAARAGLLRAIAAKIRANVEPLIVTQSNGVELAIRHPIAGAEEELPTKVQRGRETVVGEETQRVSLVCQSRVIRGPVRD